MVNWTKHCLYLLLWSGSLFWALTHEVGLWNFLHWLAFLLLFFLVTTYKHLGKMLMVAVVLGVVSAFTPVGAVIAAVSFIFVILKFKFFLQHLKAIAVGVYVYFGYLAIALIFHWIFPYAATTAAVAVTLIATAIFHVFTNKIYKRGYDTDKAFTIIGMTPWTIISVFLPFLRIDFEGQEVFHGLFSDHASIDIHTHISSEEIFNDDIADAMHEMGITTADVIKATGFDINDVMNVQEVSQAVQASVIGSTAYGLFKASNIRNEDGTVEIISPVDDTHSVIKNQDGEQIGSIYLDKENNREVVVLKNGFAYTIDNTTGNIVDGEGKILGRIIKADQDTRLLLDANNNVIRKFEADGTILDNNNHEVGVAAV